MLRGRRAIDTLFALCMGIGLAAAVGFRVFLPPFVLGCAAALGWVDLPASIDWLSSGLAITAFGVALAVELLAYMIPWIDNLLDTVATPVAVVAGTLLAASFLADLPPPLQWTLAVIAGGGASATTQGATLVGRGASSATTAGLANPVVSFLEAIASLLTTIVTIVAPLVAGLFVLVLAGFVYWRLRHRNPRSQEWRPKAP